MVTSRSEIKVELSDNSCSHQGATFEGRKFKCQIDFERINRSKI